MASYEQQAEVLSKLNAFSDRNKTNFNKRDAVLHEINRHRENQASNIKFRKDGGFFNTHFYLNHCYF